MTVRIHPAFEAAAKVHIEDAIATVLAYNGVNPSRHAEKQNVFVHPMLFRKLAADVVGIYATTPTPDFNIPLEETLKYIKGQKVSAAMKLITDECERITKECLKNNKVANVTILVPEQP